MNYWLYWDFSGKLLSSNANTNFNSQFKNRWRINGNFTRQSENIEPYMLRGGPSFIRPGTEEFNLNLHTDQSKKISLSIGTYKGLGDVNSFRAQEYWMGINVRPMNSMAISFEPSYGTQNNKLQYVSTAGINNESRYLFGELDQKTLSFTFRLNLTVNPELSLEYYGQPFVSAGNYSNFKRITDSDAGRFNERFHVFNYEEITPSESGNTYIVDEDIDGSVDYNITNPDFNFSQFRSNLVVRWEYSPGSTLFLVWSQGRTNSASTGRFSYGNDMKDLFNIVPHNVFLVKFSYWFSL
jgi:hypothetical protein